MLHESFVLLLQMLGDLVIDILEERINGQPFLRLRPLQRLEESGAGLSATYIHIFIYVYLYICTQACDESATLRTNGAAVRSNLIYIHLYNLIYIYIYICIYTGSIYVYTYHIYVIYGSNSIFIHIYFIRIQCIGCEGR